MSLSYLSTATFAMVGAIFGNFVGLLWLENYNLDTAVVNSIATTIVIAVFVLLLFLCNVQTKNLLLLKLKKLHTVVIVLTALIVCIPINFYLYEYLYGRFDYIAFVRLMGLQSVVISVLLYIYKKNRTSFRM